MDEATDGKLLRIFIGEEDEHDGQPLYEAIVELLRQEGLAGATVFRGIMGFGRSSIVHTGLPRVRLSTELGAVTLHSDRGQEAPARPHEHGASAPDRPSKYAVVLPAPDQPNAGDALGDYDWAAN